MRKAPCVTVGVMMLCFCSVTPLVAQESRSNPDLLRISTHVGRQLEGEDSRYTFGFRAEFPVLGERLGLWAAADRGYLPDIVGVGPGLFRPLGQAWTGSFGGNVYFFPSGPTPYVGIGVGLRRYTEHGRREVAKTILAGLEARGRRRMSLFMELAKRTGAPGELGLGLTVRL